MYLVSRCLVTSLLIVHRILSNWLGFQAISETVFSFISCLWSQIILFIKVICGSLDSTSHEWTQDSWAHLQQHFTFVCGMEISLGDLNAISLDRVLWRQLITVIRGIPPRILPHPAPMWSHTPSIAYLSSIFISLVNHVDRSFF